MGFNQVASTVVFWWCFFHPMNWDDKLSIGLHRSSRRMYRMECCPGLGLQNLGILLSPGTTCGRATENCGKTCGPRHGHVCLVLIQRFLGAKRAWWLLTEFDVILPNIYHIWSVEKLVVSHIFLELVFLVPSNSQGVWDAWPTKALRPAAAIAARRIRHVHSRRVWRARTRCGTACWSRTPTFVVETSQHFQARMGMGHEFTHVENRQRWGCRA